MKDGAFRRPRKSGPRPAAKKKGYTKTKRSLVLKGRARVLGDDINTDLIIAGKYCKSAEPSELASHLFESMGPSWPEKLCKSDILVAGRNFGCGSSREQAPLAIKAAGVNAVVASSFARIFYRNAINIGLPVLVLSGQTEKIKDGDSIIVDIGKGELVMAESKLVLYGEILPPFLLEMLCDGGLVPYLKKKLTPATGAQARGVR